jgi:hypothetical protein
VKPEAKPLSKFGKKPEAASAKPAAEIAGDEDKIALDAKAAEGTRTQFTQLKTITKGLRTELAARDAEIATLKKNAGTPVSTPELDRLRAEHKSMSERLSVVDLQSHPDFVRQFGEPKNAIIANINTVLADNKVDGADVASLVGKSRADFMKGASEIAAKLPEFEQHAFMTDMRQLFKLEGDAKAALTKAKEIGATLYQRSEATAKAAFEGVWNSLEFGEGLAALEVPADASDEDKAAIGEYNKAVAGVRASAEGIAFGRGDEKAMALTATKAATFDFMLSHGIPRMEAEHKQALGLIAELKGEIEALKGARKSGGDGGGGGNDGAAETSHADSASKVWTR